MRTQQFTQSNRILYPYSQAINRQHRAISQIQKTIFQYTKITKYTKNQILITEGEMATSYYIQSKFNKNITFYLGHGFGGTSLMYFPSFNQILEKGNIVLWEIRGMGIGIKNQYPEIQENKINDFYLDGLIKIINFYNHQKIVFICHSLSAYVVLRYLMLIPTDNRVLKAVLLSPVGITAKSRDYKNQINSFSGLVDSLINKLGWKFRLTFKSPMRTVLKCCNKSILKKSFLQFSMSQAEINIMTQLFQTLIFLPDGSQNIFFRYFNPRVLPKEGQSIQQLIKKTRIKKQINIYYGGEQDWVDKKGALDLSKQSQNFSYQIFRNGGHMLCIHSQIMNIIIDQQCQTQVQGNIQN